VSAPEPTDASPPPGHSLARIGLAVLLLAYAAVLYPLIGAVSGGSDNSGYFNEARLFSRLQIRAPERVLAALPPAETPPYLYVPLGFRPVADGAARIVPTYPPGFPLMLVPVAGVFGWRHSGDIILMLHSLAGIALVFALGRLCGLSGPWSLFGAAVLAASPLYLYTSLQALSDIPATAWATAAVVAAWKSRERSLWALAAGISVAVAFLVRPNNFIIVVPVVLAIGWSPRGWILAALGAIPGIGAWMAINHAAYGGILETGYGAIGKEFHGSLIAGTLLYYGKWLPLLFSPIVIASPAIVAFFRSRPRCAAVLASWMAVFLAFFAPYRWTHESWWYLRFLLPAAPAVIVAGLIVVAACLEGLKASLRAMALQAAIALLVCSALGAEVVQTLSLEAWSIGRGERKYGRVSGWLANNLPKNSVVLACQFSGSIFYFTDFTLLRGDQIDAGTAKRVRSALQSEGRPLYAVLFAFEENLIGRIPGNWSVVHSDEDVLVLRCDPPAK